MRGTALKPIIRRPRLYLKHQPVPTENERGTYEIPVEGPKLSPPNLPRMLTPEEGADWAGICRKQAYNWIHGQLPADCRVKFGRTLRVNEDRLRAWAESQTNAEPKTKAKRLG